VRPVARIFLAKRLKKQASSMTDPSNQKSRLRHQMAPNQRQPHQQPRKLRRMPFDSQMLRSHRQTLSSPAHHITTELTADRANCSPADATWESAISDHPTIMTFYVWSVDRVSTGRAQWQRFSFDPCSRTRTDTL